MNLFDVLFAKKLSGGGSPFPPVIKRVTGNPIEFSDGADAPLVKCVTQITGSQDLHGQDKPWVGGAGKNKLPLLLSKIKTFNTAGTWTGNTYVLNGITYAFQSYDNETITGVNISSNGATGRSVIYYYRDDNAPIVQSQTVTFSGIGGFNRCAYQDGITWHESTQVYFTANIIDGMTQIWCELLEGWSGSFTSAPQVEIGSTPTTFAPYSNICPITAYTEGEIEVSDGDGNTTTHNTTYPSAIYRGSEDVVNGTETHDMPCVDLGDLAWSYNSTAKTFYTPLGTIAKRYTASEIANALSEKFGIMSNSDITNDLTLDGVFSIHYEAQQSWLNVRWLDYTVASDLKTAVTGTKLAYELATPTTSSITPTNLPIKSLSGYNHIESSTGDMTIDYITDAYQNFVDTVENALPNTTRNLLSASKGGVKAFDIFKTLDEPKKPEASAEESEPEEKEIEEGAKK